MNENNNNEEDYAHNFDVSEASSERSNSSDVKINEQSSKKRMETINVLDEETDKSKKEDVPSNEEKSKYNMDSASNKSSGSNVQSFKNEKNLITLENFNPFTHEQKINSPRSLEVCKAQGIEPSSLYYKSFEMIKSKFLSRSIDSSNPLKRNNKEYLKIKYFETEKKRQECVDELRFLRSQIVANESLAQSKEIINRGHTEPVSRITTRRFRTGKHFPSVRQSTERQDPNATELVIIIKNIFFRRLS